jgi:hypothetical protein
MACVRDKNIERLTQFCPCICGVYTYLASRYSERATRNRSKGSHATPEKDLNPLRWTSSMRAAKIREVAS